MENSSFASEKMQNQLVSPDFFRMEKSVLSKSNFDNLLSISRDSIPESLLEYICFEHQYNIFGYGTIDPESFAEKFKFSKRYLFEQHANPFQRQFERNPENYKKESLRLRPYVENKDDVFICSNRLENALYILTNFPLDVTSTSIGDNNLLIRKYEPIRILEGFSIIQDRNTGKVKYTYKLNEKFRRNLSSMYLTASLSSFTALRKSGLVILYTFLLRMRDSLYRHGKTQTEIENTPDFAYLCQLANISENIHPKYQKRNLIIALNKIRNETELKFNLSWEFGEGKERYVPIFMFDADVESHFYKTGLKKTERINVAINEFIHNLVETCPYGDERYSLNAEDYFFKWIKSDDKGQLERIRTALVQTFINIGSGIPSDITERVNRFHSLAKSQPASELNNWLKEIFDKIPVFNCTVLD